jgi:hypothetical protein
MNATELTERLIDDLEFSNKATTIIPTPHNVVNAVSNAAKKGEVLKFYLEEFTASISLNISIPAIIKHLTVYLNIGDVIIDEKGKNSLWDFLERIKGNRNHIEEKIKNIIENRNFVFISGGGNSEPISEHFLEQLDELNREAQIIKRCVDKITGG